MNMNNLRVGTRLALGFGVVVLLMVTMLIVGIWRLSSMSRITENTLKVPLAKERLADEWFRNVTAGVVRARAVAKSADASLESLFAEDVKASTLRGNQINDSLKALPATPDEQQLSAAIVETRKAYIKTRDTLMSAKAAGRADEANRLYDTEFVANSSLYIKAMQAYLDFQRSAIDAASHEVEIDGASGIRTLSMLGTTAVLLAALLAWRLTRSITVPVAAARRIADQVAKGDLSAKATVVGTDEFAELQGSLAAMTVALQSLIGTVRQSADSIETSSAEVSAGNLDLSHRTESQASSLQQTAASMEQLNSTVKQNADNAKRASQVANSASAVAVAGGTAMTDVVSTMQGITESSRKIGDIIGVIDGIAFQTNILALNAAVEAARAGDQGRGFAVVASEVRSLAKRSAQAAREIKDLISASVQRVETGTVLVDRAGVTMQEVVSSIRKVTEIVAEISSASDEQSEGVAQIGAAVMQMDQVTQQNAALVEQSAAAAHSLKEQAAQLVVAVSGFKVTAH